MPARSSARPRFVASAALGASALVLVGCVPNAPAGTVLTVDITDTGCEVSADTAPAGAVRFELSNSGTDANEFEILAEDQLRIVGEKENITPGQTVSYVAQLDPGTYYTACKFQMVGAPTGLAEFTVTGDALAVDADRAALEQEAVAGYLAYVRSQAGELLPAVQALVDAYRSGDDERARALYASARVSYERIEPTAEAFGDLDPKIDYREVDAVAEGLDWTGFHRIEKDLWVPGADALNSDGASAWIGWMPSTPEQRAEFGDQLVADVQQLLEQVTDPSFQLSLSDISNGATALLDEVATGKISGEEDWWSHTDLSDFAANVDGASVAFGNVTKLAAQSEAGADLVTRIETQFDALERVLARYGSFEDGFTPYDQVSDAERKQLSDAVNALAEPLAQLTSTVLGV
ncbi:MAG: iron uptake system protein EfeO [Protaetiibacter sp.]